MHTFHGCLLPCPPAHCTFTTSVLRVQWVADVRPDDFITFKVGGGTHLQLCLRVLDVQAFPTFAAIVYKHGLAKCLPGCEDLCDACDAFHTLANRNGAPYRKLEEDHGVVALTVELIRSTDETHDNASCGYSLSMGWRERAQGYDEPD